MKRDDLTPKQLAVVESTADTLLVRGGAGTGKTTVALWAAREHLLAPDTAGHSRVLFVTFSRTATAQIARRAGAVLGEDRSRIEIQTFHSVALRLINAFSRFHGGGVDPVQVGSKARESLLGLDGSVASYDELVPMALELFENPRLRSLIAHRWSLVVCDEFQDTTLEQWQLLQHARIDGRLLLLADPHQMIYSWLDTVGEERLDEAATLTDEVIDLEERSHRDPSGAIPAMATAVRERRFDDDALQHAAQEGRLRIASCADPGVAESIAETVRALRRQGHGLIGVFETTNDDAATASAGLTEHGIGHTLIGVPEAHGEGLLAMAFLLSHGVGLASFEDVRIQLGVFLTACTRGNDAPPLAKQWATGSIAGDVQRADMEALKQVLSEQRDDMESLLDTVSAAWDRLRMDVGAAAWDRARRSFVAVARRVMSTESDPEMVAEAVMEECQALQAQTIATADVPMGADVHVMNFHQTKGRESDAVVLVYRPGGFVTGRLDREPYSEKSRVLYVALTRARKTVVVLLPPSPHALVAPLNRYSS